MYEVELGLAWLARRARRSWSVNIELSFRFGATG